MADFVIYKLDLVPTGNYRTDTPQGEKIDGAWLMNYVRSMIKLKAQWSVPNQKGDQRPILVMQRQGDVAVLYVHNAQKHEIYKLMEKEPQELMSQPHCNVVVDMRGESVLLAVERSSFFRSETDAAMKMVLDVMERMVDTIARVEVSCMYHVGDFWEVVHYRTETLKDTVRSVTFHFDKDADQSKASDRVRALMSFNMAEGGGAGSYTREAASKNDGMVLRQEDYNELVCLCEQNKEYQLSVKFRDCGAYRVGRAAKYFWRMTPGFIEHFVNSQPSALHDGGSEWDLVNWIDALMAKTGDYQFRLIYSGYGTADKKAKIQVA